MNAGPQRGLENMPEHATTARAVLDRNRYLTLATADRDGRPWSSPTVVPGTARAVYLRATAAQIDDRDGIEVFSRAASAPRPAAATSASPSISR
jgi:hypothetical protein